jgi:hypothetical protein
MFFVGPAVFLRLSGKQMHLGRDEKRKNNGPHEQEARNQWLWMWADK